MFILNLFWIIIIKNYCTHNNHSAIFAKIIIFSNKRGSNFNGPIFIFQILNNWGSNFNGPIFNFFNFEQLIVCLSDFFLKNILCVPGLDYHVQFRLSMANAFVLECVFVRMCLHSYAHWEFLSHDNFCVLNMSIYIYNILGVRLSGCPPWGKGVRVSTPFINMFP